VKERWALHCPRGGPLGSSEEASYRREDSLVFRREDKRSGMAEEVVLLEQDEGGEIGHVAEHARESVNPKRAGSAHAGGSVR
jgi:hypothetical protein